MFADDTAIMEHVRDERGEVWYTDHLLVLDFGKSKLDQSNSTTPHYGRRRKDGEEH